MMGEMGGHHVWEEPMVGRLFGEFYAGPRRKTRAPRTSSWGSRSAKGGRGPSGTSSWTGPATPTLASDADDYLVIKEPNGSVGAPLLMEALPESRMILLVRDPRDVVASCPGRRQRGRLAVREPEWRSLEEALSRRQGAECVREQRGPACTGGAWRAPRPPTTLTEVPRSLISYEDLLADTLGTIKRLYAALGHSRRRGRADQGSGEALLGERTRGGEREGQVLPQGRPGRLERGPHPQAGGDSRAHNGSPAGRVLSEVELLPALAAILCYPLGGIVG